MFNVSCNGLSNETRPDKIGIVVPIDVEATKLTHPNTAWFDGANLVFYVEPDEKGKPVI